MAKIYITVGKGHDHKQLVRLVREYFNSTPELRGHTFNIDIGKELAVDGGTIQECANIFATLENYMRPAKDLTMADKITLELSNGKHSWHKLFVVAATEGDMYSRIRSEGLTYFEFPDATKVCFDEPHNTIAVVTS